MCVAARVRNVARAPPARAAPQSLYTAMREHIELQFYSERTADETVLQYYPSTIKRKVLRWAALPATCTHA